MLNKNSAFGSASFICVNKKDPNYSDPFLSYSLTNGTSICVGVLTTSLTVGLQPH